MAKTNQKAIKREVRQRRIRAKVKGTSERPRVSVFKSNKFLYAQIIDDTKGNTLVSVSSNTLKKGTKSDHAKEIGVMLAKEAKSKGIEKVVFDRGGYIYIGRIRTLADALREGGLIF